MFSFWKKNKENETASLLDILQIKAQLESQIRILFSLGVIEHFTDSNTMGIKGINDNKYLVPTFEEIASRIKDNEDFLYRKSKQGFTKLILVPFAFSLDTIIRKYEDVIRRHYANNKLFYTPEAGSDRKSINLNKENPLNVWNEFNESDINNTMVYFPKTFKKDRHLGKTKREIIVDPQNAWSVILIEDKKEIPRSKKGTTRNKRRELEAKKSPEEYLQEIQTNPMYQGEVGLTPEAMLIHAITYLEEENSVLNDWLGAGCIEYSLGGFFGSTENVPWSSWNSDFNRADLWKANSWNRDEFMGTRTCVVI